jgi:hypothetical protein
MSSTKRTGQAAGLNIIKPHFSGCEINMQPFMNMKLNVHPHAIAWMAIDYHLHQFLWAMPLLLEKLSKKRAICREEVAAK